MESSNLIAAGALIYCSSTQRYLFLLRSSERYENSWGLVGGKIHANESIIEGLCREIREEIDQNFDNNKIIPLEKFTSDSGNFFYHTFAIIVNKEFIPNLNPEHKGYCWVPLLNYPKPLHPGVWRTFSFDVVINKLKTLEHLGAELA